MIVALRRFEAGIDKLGRIGSVVAMRGAFTRWDDYTEPFRQEIRRRITRKMEMENAAVRMVVFLTKVFLYFCKRFQGKKGGYLVPPSPSSRAE